MRRCALYRSCSPPVSDNQLFQHCSELARAREVQLHQHEVGDGAYYMHVPPVLDGLNLTYVHARCITAGTTNTLDVQIYNLTQTADMLSTVLTIDSGETGSDTAATPAAIDTGNDDVAVNDVLRVDIDAIHTTAGKGLIVTLGFS